MRSPLATLLVIALVSGRAPAADADLDRLETAFRATVRPFLTSYCLGCHSKAKAKGGLDLSGFTSADVVAKDYRRLETVVGQLHAGAMPPDKADQPKDEERRAVIAWAKEVRRYEGKRTAGDPGPVPARRLSNAEYDNTVRDLTGHDLRPTREFPVDPANEAGFDNSAESLAMSPALVKKYLAAARRVADHIIFAPDGLDFAPFPVVTDTDRDKYCVRRIIDFYQRQRTDYADYFHAAWRYRHRAALGRPAATLADTAAEAGISAKYLTTIWAVLTDTPETVGPAAALRALWAELPDAAKPDAARAGCERMRDFVVNLRQQLVPEVKNLTAPGVGNGSQTMVMWKNRQFVANRMRYAGGAAAIKPTGLAPDSPAAKALAVPTEKAAIEKFEATFQRFCSTFPDAFYVTERGRVFLKDSAEKKGRLLSAGFHSMTGYFRDDGPLYQLILDEAGQKELDRLWLEFDVITGAPLRQHTGFIWFERAESGYFRDTAFDRFRSEDKDSTSEAQIRAMAEVYIAKARRLKASDVAVGAMADHFRTISAAIRVVETTRARAEPTHLSWLETFAERAYRRPLTPAERADVTTFYRTLRDKEGLGHEDAVRDTVVSVLMSPRFCYRIAPPAGDGVRPLDGYALASRLSYFLWASMPDAELLARAAAGDLHKPDVLIAQSRRMLRDPKARGLATEFAANWLDVRQFEQHNSVDRGRFPAFTDELRQAMFEEPVRFFQDVVREDRSVLDFLYAKHTFVNPVLAKHYGMPPPKDWARVDDADKYGRGGLLPMAAFLTRNSPGLRTSPVKRGYWVVRRLLGESIPAPPSEVPELPADEAKLGERTLREALAKHREHKSCAGCHNRFDSVGVAFEGFGPVGERRDKDLGGRPVDTRAAFPDGGEGAGLDGLRAYLREHCENEFVENLCGKLLAYALGRSLRPSDDATILAMRAALAADRYRFGRLVEAVVTSPAFLNRRTDGPPQAER